MRKFPIFVGMAQIEKHCHRTRPRYCSVFHSYDAVWYAPDLATTAL